MNILLFVIAVSIGFLAGVWVVGSDDWHWFVRGAVGQTITTFVYLIVHAIECWIYYLMNPAINYSDYGPYD